MIAILIGAGFNVDANQYYSAGDFLCRHRECDYNWCPDPECDRPRYPLVNGLLSSCFHLSQLPPDTSVEDLFTGAAAAGDREPLLRLARVINLADSHIPSYLLDADNPYSKFFERFPDSPVFTWNYDCLVEAILFRRGRWHPSDGFGVPAKVNLRWLPDPPQIRKTTQPVVHLHGCLWLYSDDFQSADHLLRQRAIPAFEFDAPAPTSLPFLPRAGVEDYEERIVPLVIDKRAFLERVKWAHLVAEQFMSTVDAFLAIGYSFSPHDRITYEPLIKSLLVRSGSLYIVSPDAGEVARRLTVEFPALKAIPIASTFRRWVESGLPLVPHQDA